MGMQLLKKNEAILETVHQTKEEVETTERNSVLTPFLWGKRADIAVLHKKINSFHLMCEEYSVLLRLFMVKEESGANQNQNKQLWEKMVQLFKMELEF